MKVVIAEKPSVARDIARHLHASRSEKGFFEGNGYAVTWAFGHLVELQEPEAYKPEWKTWKLATLPIIPDRFALRPRDEATSNEQLDTIVTLLQNADEIVCATDAGREGELIFRYILSWAGCERKPFKRLWISSLTEKAIAEGFENLVDGHRYDPLYQAAKCRSEADWVVGINATRFFTVEYGKRNLLLSIGRVQTPILAMIVNRDLEIESFDSKDYWEVHTVSQGTRFKHAKGKFESRMDADKTLARVEGHELKIESVDKKEEKSNPPLLFDLTALQREMNTQHGLTADQTLRIAQNLYERKLITYPRTDSRYLTSDMQPSIGPLLEKFRPYRKEEIGPLELGNLNFGKRIVDDSKVGDHHAIIPTEILPEKLEGDEKLLYNAILNRLIAVFYPPCIKAVTTVEAITGGERFKARGTVIIDPGWQRMYPPRSVAAKRRIANSTDGSAQPMPDFQIGERCHHQPSVETFKTSPPKRFTEASLLQLMETAGKAVEDETLKEALKERGVGTPATRAAIIETLIQRGYVERKRKSLFSAPKGRQLIALVQDDRLKSPELTGEWEYRLKKMERGEYDPERFMGEVASYTRQILSATSKNTLDLKNLGPCPRCKAAVIRGRAGYGCSQWRNGCSFSVAQDAHGARITPELMREILLNGRSLSPLGIDSGDGRALAYLLLSSQGKLEYEIVEPEKKGASSNSIGDCPLCGGSVEERERSYSCCNWRQGCPFSIWKSIASRELDLETVKELIQKGHTPLLDGFTSKKGNTFSAKLALRDGKVTFDFQD